MEIGEAIKEVRTRAGLDQKDVVARIDRSDTDVIVDQPMLSKMERSKAVPSIRDLSAIERAMGVPLGTVLVMSGYVENVGSVAQAVAADDKLSAGDKTVVLTAYEGALALARARGREAQR